MNRAKGALPADQATEALKSLLFRAATRPDGGRAMGLAADVDAARAARLDATLLDALDPIMIGRGAAVVS